MQTRRFALAALAVAASTGLAACGNKEERVHKAETEGIYVDVGNLKYQVQISRQLNPVNIEDKDYLVGLSKFDQALGADNVYFAVFIRVENDSDTSGLSAKKFELKDTQEHTFDPIALDRSNVYAYRSGVVPGHSEFNVNGLNPELDSSASEGPTQGALLLFKLPRETLVNRPLELVIHQPDGKDEASIDLDV